MAAARKKEQSKFEMKFENLDETSADAEELSHEMQGKQDIAANLVDRFKNFKEDLESSFDRERSGMEEYFDNEKNDIIKGFILEKQILNKEHEKEKQGLIQTFVQERQKMLQEFQTQVKDIETKMKKTEQNESMPSEPRIDNDILESSASKLLIRLDGNRIITPQEFLATLELEEKFESEKESIEKSFRKDKERIKDKLEIDYERRISREKQKHDNEVKVLHRDIDNLKSLKFEVGTMWKQQATKLETEFHKERTALEKHYKSERENLRKKLDDRSEAKLRKQQVDYDRSITELKCELRRIKNDAVKHENTVIDQSQKIRSDVSIQLRESFDRETKIIREQNEKLSENIKELTTEKYNLNQQLREQEINLENEKKTQKHQSEKHKKEYEYKTRKLISQIDRLKIQLIECEKQKEGLSHRAESNEADNKDIEGRLIMTDRAVAECEDIIVGMRIENTNLSHEINLLRNEKDDILKSIEQYQESERNLKSDISRLTSENNETTGSYALLEREKLKHERLIVNLRKELESSVNLCKENKSKNVAFEKEANRLRQLLEGERKENKRLHARFKQDAELLRKRETDNSIMRTQLDDIKTEFENMKVKIDADNDRILKTSSEKQALITEIEKIKAGDTLQHKREIVSVQNQYVKEFAKRLEYVKANYEREIKNLKNTIETLKYIKCSNNNLQQQCNCQQGTNQCGQVNNFNNFQTTKSTQQECTTTQSTNQWKLMDNVTDFSSSFNYPKHKQLTDNATVDQIFQYLEETKNADQRNSKPEPPVCNNNSGKSTDCSRTAENIKLTSSHAPLSLHSNTFDRTNQNSSSLNCSDKNVLNHNDKGSAFQSVNYSPINVHSVIRSPVNLHSENIKHTNQNSVLKDSSVTKDQIKSRLYPWSDHGNGITYPYKVMKETSSQGQKLPEIPCKVINGGYDYHNGSIPYKNRNGANSSSPKNRSDSNNTPELDMNDLIDRVASAESNHDNEELRQLLKDVRKEVLLLNKMIDQNTPVSTPRYSPSIKPDILTNNSTPLKSLNNGTIEETREMQNKLANKESEMNESKEEMRRLYEENTELQRRITQQQEEIANQGNSCDELFKRRMTLERLVDRLQVRLRDETSKRRQLEQEKNAINEETNEDIDDSTV